MQRQRRGYLGKAAQDACPQRPSLPLPTCRRWPRRQHCARCSGARGARWLRGSRLSRLWSGGRRRRLGAHSTLGRRKQPRPQVRATGSSVGSGISNVTSPALKREEETAQEPPLRKQRGWTWEGRGGATPFLDVREGKNH